MKFVQMNLHTEGISKENRVFIIVSISRQLKFIGFSLIVFFSSIRRAIISKMKTAKIADKRQRVLARRCDDVIRKSVTNIFILVEMTRNSL